MSTPKKNLLEWMVFGVSVAVIGGTVVLVSGGALRSHGAASPDLRVQTLAPMRSSGGYTVPVIVRNDGTATAEEARIEVALVSDGRELEKAELIIAFVPRSSRRAGAVVFRRDPACCVVVGRVAGYETP